MDIVTVPSYAVLLVFCTLIFMALTLSAMFTFALSNADISNRQRQSVALRVSAYVTLWISLALGLAYSNILVPSADQRIPLLGILILGSAILGNVLLTRSKTLTLIVDATPLHWLAAVQIYRVIGVVFLLLEADGYLSSYFARSTGWGDILVGLTAPIVGYLMWKDARRYYSVGLIWCAAGIIDLLLVLYKALNSAPGPFQTTAFDVPTVVIGYFPFPLVPLIVVPISLILHVQMARKILNIDRTRLALSGT
ncbi:MAG: hypothetical protein AAFV87_03135 [Pseudomonadota bacterium]